MKFTEENITFVSRGEKCYFLPLGIAGVSKKDAFHPRLRKISFKTRGKNDFRLLRCKIYYSNTIKCWISREFGPNLSFLKNLIIEE